VHASVYSLTRRLIAKIAPVQITSVQGTIIQGVLSVEDAIV
jgi:hypothetical protein